MENKISIIIPVYNAEHTLDQCIQSAIEQSSSDFEIVIINDGSTDGSRKIIDKYKEMHDFIKVIHKENEGVAIARNIGIKNSNGNYLMFLDADDWIEKDSVEKLQMLLIEKQADIIGFECVVEESEKKSKSEYIYERKFSDKVNELIDQLSISFIWDKLFKKSIIMKNNIKFEEHLSYGEDTLFLIQFLLSIEIIAVLPEHLYHYRKSNNDSLSNKYIANMDKTFEEIVRQQTMLINKYNGYGQLIKKTQYYEVMCVHIIYDLYNEKSTYTHTQRKTKLNYFLTNELYNVVRTARPKSSYKRAIVLLFNMRNAVIMDAVLSLIKFVRKHLRGK